MRDVLFFVCTCCLWLAIFQVHGLLRLIIMLRMLWWSNRSLTNRRMYLSKKKLNCSRRQQQQQQHQHYRPKNLCSFHPISLQSWFFSHIFCLFVLHPLSSASLAHWWSNSMFCSLQMLDGWVKSFCLQHLLLFGKRAPEPINIPLSASAVFPVVWWWWT